MLPTSSIAILWTLMTLLSACTILKPASYHIDPTLTAPGVPKTVISAGEERPVGLLIAPGGVREAFVIDEVVLRAETQEELNAFLDKYHGTILEDGSLSSLPLDFRVRDVPRSKWYLIRVDLSRSSLDDLPRNMTRAGIQGNVVFSSEDAARLAAIVAHEAREDARANLLMYSTDSLEHPDYSGGHLDAESFDWMNEDDPFRPGDQGLSVGVYHGWEALTYKNIPPTPPSSWSPIRVALVDNGFALDTTTGIPLLGNVDYFNSFNAPLQWDVKGDDGRAGGTSDVDLDGGGSSPWHGQEAFGVCCAAERNQFGGAGTGGPVAQPILIRTGGTMYSVADAIYEAANMGAQVINISMGAECDFLCAFSDTFRDNKLGTRSSRPRMSARSCWPARATAGTTWTTFIALSAVRIAPGHLRRVRVVSRGWWKLGGAGSKVAWWGGSGSEVKVGR